MSKLGTILACDPGNVQSAFVLYDREDRVPVSSWLDDNASCRDILSVSKADEFVVEYTKPYVMRTKSGHPYFPEQVLHTAIEIGRFIECWKQRRNEEPVMLSRTDVIKVLVNKEVKSRLGKGATKDALVSQAIIDRYGGTRQIAVGLKKSPGPLFGFRRDMWQAMAVAIAYDEINHHLPLL